MSLTAQATVPSVAPASFPLSWHDVKGTPGVYECSTGAIVIISSNPGNPAFRHPDNPDICINTATFAYEPTTGRFTVGIGRFSDPPDARYRRYAGTISLSNS